MSKWVGETEKNLERIFGMFPAEAELGDDVDFAALAELFELFGAYIKEAALHAAFCAAERGCAITHELLDAAPVLQYRKLGKLLSRNW